MEAIDSGACFIDEFFVATLDTTGEIFDLFHLIKYDPITLNLWVKLC